VGSLALHCRFPEGGCLLPSLPFHFALAGRAALHSLALQLEAKLLHVPPPHTSPFAPSLPVDAGSPTLLKLVASCLADLSRELQPTASGEFPAVLNRSEAEASEHSKLQEVHDSMLWLFAEALVKAAPAALKAH